MVGTTKSNSVKAHERLNRHTALLTDAVRAWKTEQEDPTILKKRSLRSIAREYDIAPQTLSDHIHEKHRSRRQFLDDQLKLSTQQESTLVELLQNLDSWGMGCDRKEVLSYANGLLNRGKRGSSQTLGKRWVDGFMDRHHHELGPRWTSPLDRKRTNGLSPLTAEQHFQCVKETTEKYEIVPENDYGMDESSVMLGCGAKRRVVGRKETKAGKRVKQSHSRRDGNRETVTVVETICADGSVLKPSVIFKGKQFNKAWAGPEKNTMEAQ
jgi:hypothetical protein